MFQWLSYDIAGCVWCSSTQCLQCIYWYILSVLWIWYALATLHHHQEHHHPVLLPNHCHLSYISYNTIKTMGQNGVVQTDGLGIESQWRQDFLHLSRLALGSTQPPVQWAQSMFPIVKKAGHGNHHSSLFSSKVKEGIKLRFYSPSGPVLGWTSPSTININYIKGSITSVCMDMHLMC
jgi:hypothetical protein